MAGEKTNKRLRVLYEIETCKDSYGARHVVVVLEDEKGKRYVWATSKRTKGYKSLSAIKKNTYCETTFCKQAKLTGGDIKIEQLQVS